MEEAVRLYVQTYIAGHPIKEVVLTGDGIEHNYEALVVFQKE
jgi:hypothetical protein